MSFGSLTLAIFFLLGGAALAGTTTAFHLLGRIRAKEEFKKLPSLFFFQHLLKPLFGKRRWEGLYLTLSFGKHVLRLSYAVAALFFLLTRAPFNAALNTLNPLWIIAAGALIIALSLSADLLLKFFATAAPATVFKMLAPISSVFLTLFAPLTSLVFRMLAAFFPGKSKPSPAEASIRDKILEVLYESELSTRLDPQERKLILSVANFKQRTVRE
ncbi:MAG: hypothetical protein ABSA17_08430, partial [Rhabdochlamydiaceae bacterium]